MSTLSQAFPPPPTYTEESLPDQSGKVFIVTGSAVGVGYELAKMLFAKNGTVYIATRSKEKIDSAIASLKKDYPGSRGRVESLILDLSDLPTIKPAAMRFLEKENRLDVLVHNAAVMRPPKGSTSVQGHDLEMATNCLGPFLLNHHLQGVLSRTSKSNGFGPGTVRIVWLTSFIESTANGGIMLDVNGAPKVLPDAMENYLASKVGNVFLAHECAKRLGNEGIISVSVNPGLMKTELQRHMNPLVRGVMGVVFKPAKYGAYTELYAGFSPDVLLKHNGGFIIPRGRHGKLPQHVSIDLKSKEEGGTGLSNQFWDWCTKETGPYL